MSRLGAFYTENWFDFFSWERAYFFWTARRSSDAPTPTSRYLMTVSYTHLTLPTKA